MSKIDSTDAILAMRRETHGDFTAHAQITQALKDTMRVEPGWADLNGAQKEALEMIVHKIGRALAGDPNHTDHWDDIAGYAKLVSNRIRDGKDSPLQSAA